MRKSILIIGAGPGGYETAVLAARNGYDVKLVSSGPLGGTCLNEGCIPTKCLCHTASELETIKKYNLSLNYDVLWSESIASKKNVVSKLQDGVKFLLKAVEIIYGTAYFEDKDTVKVQTETEELVFKPDYIIIATGSVTTKLELPGVDNPSVITSTELLDLERPPKSIAIVGAGVIGLEFASILNSFGTQVTVLEYCKDIIPAFDTDISKRLKQALSKRGINIINQAQIQSIKSFYQSEIVSYPESNTSYKRELVVEYIYKEGIQTLEVEKVLMAVGRKSNFSALNLSDAGVEFNDRSILVDEKMLSSNPKVYAIGDVNAKLMLAHAASAQGKIALYDICKKDAVEPDFKTPNLDITPSIVFTVPELAIVGMSEEECKTKSLDYKVIKKLYRSNGKAMTMDADGIIKIIHSGDKILGCQILGPHSSELISEITLAIANDIGLSNIYSTIHAHPTLSELFI